jgi:ferric-dicitrate binding protein FerR (iron transport regulator)
MSGRPDDELERLLHALVEADSPEAAEECESQLAPILRNDAAARRRYREFMGLHSALMWDYAAAATDRPENVVVMETPRTRAPWRRALQWAAVIAVAGLAAALFFAGGRKSANHHEVARAESVEGAVSWSSDNGGQRAVLSSGVGLAAGTLSVEGASSSAQLRFDDGTVLTLTGDAELGFSDDGQKRLVLRRGAFTGHVAHQPAGRPMVVRTNTAEIEVLGTVFALASEQNQTTLNVESGAPSKSPRIGWRWRRSMSARPWRPGCRACPRANGVVRSMHLPPRVREASGFLLPLENRAGCARCLLSPGTVRTAGWWCITV